MAKRKRTKVQTTIYKTYNKTKDRVKTGGELNNNNKIYVIMVLFLNDGT
jgi:hypothetical protein